jgi:hypothetical protein
MCLLKWMRLNFDMDFKSNEPTASCGVPGVPIEMDEVEF